MYDIPSDPEGILKLKYGLVNRHLTEHYDRYCAQPVYPHEWVLMENNWMDSFIFDGFEKQYWNWVKQHLRCNIVQYRYYKKL